MIIHDVCDDAGVVVKERVKRLCAAFNRNVHLRHCITLAGMGLRLVLYIDTCLVAAGVVGEARGWQMVMAGDTLLDSLAARTYCDRRQDAALAAATACTLLLAAAGFFATKVTEPHV